MLEPTTAKMIRLCGRYMVIPYMPLAESEKPVDSFCVLAGVHLALRF
jgi:hypothetical protein